MKPSLKFVCAAAVAAGASIATLEATKAMTVAPLAQTAAPPPLQGVTSNCQDETVKYRPECKGGIPANSGASPPRGVAREHYAPRRPSGKPGRYPELQ
jgi:hypothetical protein